MRFINHFFVAIVCVVIFSAGAFAQKSTNRIASSLDSLLSRPYFDSAIVSLDVHDLTSNIPVFSKNNKLPLRSASNMKVLTAAAALHYLGSDFKITTKIFTTGTVKRGVVNGNLILKGGGDPLFDLSNMDSLVAQLKKAGVRVIQGRVIPDVSLFDTLRWSNGWMWDDDPYADAPYITPLSINRNSVSVKIDYNTEEESFIVKIEPESKFFAVRNQINVDSSALTNVSFKHSWDRGKEIIFCNGSWNPSDTVYKENISILRPAEFFAFLFKEKCKEAGIHIRNNTLKTLTAHSACMAQQTHTIGEIVEVMNKSSNNLCAELLSRDICSAKMDSLISGEEGLRYTDSLISKAGFNPKNYRIADGSGASHYNMVTAELLNGILKYFYKHEPQNYPVLKNSFPQAGVDGTLRNRMTTGKAYKRVFAKTGTISGVSALSGYVTGQSGNDYSFSILMQINPRDTNHARRIQDAICEVLAAN